MSSRPGGSLRRGAVGALCLVAFAAPPGAAVDDLSPGAVRVHLHNHAFSNHNGAVHPASLELQAAGIAALPGDDFLWWTEHVELFRLRERYDLPLGRLHYDREKGTLAEVEPAKSTKKQARGWRVEATDRVAIEPEAHGFAVRVAPGSAARSESVRLSPVGGRGRIRLTDFARPIPIGTGLRLAFRSLDLPEDATLAVTCTLSAHPGVEPWMPVLRFHVRRKGGAAPGAPVLAPDRRSVDVDVAAPAPPEPLFLDLEKAARLLPDGEDNTLVGFSLVAENRSDDSLAFFLDRATVESRRFDADSLRATLLTLHRRYESRYDLPQMFACEYRMRKASEHRCAFFPFETTADWFGLDRTLAESAWIERVHRAGGLVSVCHLLGTNPNLESTDEARVVQRDEVFRTVRDARANGADLLEVGYRARGGNGTSDYLLLWDALTASGVDLTGIGVTDSHGEPPARCFNPWASWVYADANAASILKGLRGRRCYLGDFSAWDGRLDLVTPEGVMGDRLATSPDSTELTVRLSPAPPDLEVLLTLFPLGQTIESTEDLVYTVKDEPFAANTPVRIALPGPCAIRAAVYRRMPDGSTWLVALSNPILYLGPPET